MCHIGRTDHTDHPSILELGSYPYVKSEGPILKPYVIVYCQMSEVKLWCIDI